MDYLLERLETLQELTWKELADPATAVCQWHDHDEDESESCQQCFPKA